MEPSDQTSDDETETQLRAIGRRIREVRESKGLSQEVLADVAGMHWSCIGCVERGHRNPNLRNVLRLARALATNLVSVSWVRSETPFFSTLLEARRLGNG